MSGKFFRIEALTASHSTQYTNFFSLFDIEGFESTDATGTDVFLNQTATAHSQYDIYSPERAIDGNLSTAWLSSPFNSDLKWFQVEMSVSRPIKSIRIYPNDNDNTNADLPIQCALKESEDGINWVQYDTINTQNLINQWQVFTNLNAGAAPEPVGTILVFQNFFRRMMQG